jgi:hypothetical protein
MSSSKISKEATLDIEDSSDEEEEKNEQLSEVELAALKMEANMRERVAAEEKQNKEIINAIVQGERSSKNVVVFCLVASKMCA